MTEDSNAGAIRVEYILDAPLNDNVARQWPQMGEVVRGRQLVSDVEAHFDTFTLEVGRRMHFGSVIVAEWSADYGDGRIYRNVTIGELNTAGEAVTVTDYWGEPSLTPDWRASLTERLDMPSDGIWKDHDHLNDH